MLQISHHLPGWDKSNPVLSFICSSLCIWRWLIRHDNHWCHSECLTKLLLSDFSLFTILSKSVDNNLFRIFICEILSSSASTMVFTIDIFLKNEILDPTMFTNENKKIGFVLTSITVITSLSASLISLIIFCLIIYHISRDRMRKRDKVILLLCGNIYLCILIYMIILSSMNIQTILGDLYERNFESAWCKFVGYMSPTILCVLYYSFVNQVRILE